MLDFGKKRMGVYISPDGIRWVEARGEGESAELVCAAFEALPAGTVRPSFTRVNIDDRELLEKHLINVIPAGKRGGDVALSLPDSLVRVTLVEFDELPAKREELEKLIFWRLKKTLPIPAEDAKVDYSILKRKEGKIELLTAIASKKVLREYEDILRGLGLRPRLVDIASLNALAMFREKIVDNALFVNVSGRESVGMALIVDGGLVFFRSKELEGDIKRVGKEVVSTLTYHAARTPELLISDLYLLCGEDCAEDVAEGLKLNFKGEIHRLKMAEKMVRDKSLHDKEYFSPAAGAALRL